MAPPEVNIWLGVRAIIHPLGNTPGPNCSAVKRRLLENSRRRKTLSIYKAWRLSVNKSNMSKCI